MINQFGEAIPGLYAGGELTGGLWHKSYLLAIMSSASCTQGYLAGQNIVKEDYLAAVKRKSLPALFDNLRQSLRLFAKHGSLSSMAPLKHCGCAY